MTHPLGRPPAIAGGRGGGGRQTCRGAGPGRAGAEGRWRGLRRGGRAGGAAAAAAVTGEVEARKGKAGRASSCLRLSLRGCVRNGAATE